MAMLAQTADFEMEQERVPHKRKKSNIEVMYMHSN